MSIALRLTVAAVLSALLAGCAGSYDYGPGRSGMTLQQQSMQTLYQASQLGSKAN